MSTQPAPKKNEEITVQGPATGPQNTQEEIPVVSSPQEEAIPVITGEQLEQLTVENPEISEGELADSSIGQRSRRLLAKRRWYVASFAAFVAALILRRKLR